MEKQCFVCKDVKLLDNFYVHKSMPDGYLNKCKECTKKQARDRQSELRNDPDWVEKERLRGRKKYHNLYKTNPSFEVNEDYKAVFMTEEEAKQRSRIYHKDFKDNYPEKKKAHSATQRMKPVVEGNQLHHWSYNEDHYKDVIELPVIEHNKLHRYIIYDHERFMYRRTDTMELLDTREKHEAFYNSLSGKL